MIAKSMIANRGTRVLDANNKTIGFVFAEPVAGRPDSQLQRWILRGVRGSYRFQEWQMPVNKTWKEMVTTPCPDDGDTWGDDPAQGLWVKNALYVIAQSTPVVPGPGPAPTPTFPRPVVRARRTSVLPRSWEHQVESADVPLQIIIGDYVLTMAGAVQGWGYGDLEIDKHEDEEFFESTEYILIQPAAPAAYLLAQGPEAPGLSLDPGDLRCQDAAEFHAYATANYKDGSRYDVVGCNYYRSKDQPPGHARETFLFS